MEGRAIARYIRVAPRKARLVGELIRGKDVESAYALLQFTRKAAALPVLKALKSAVSNALNREAALEVEPSQLYVAEIRVDPGPTLKRIQPRAMGRAFPILKRTSHITVVVKKREP